MSKLGYILNHFCKISLGKLEINSPGQHCPIKVQITQTNNDRAVNFKWVQQKTKLTERAAIPVYSVCFFGRGTAWLQIWNTLNHCFQIKAITPFTECIFRNLCWDSVLLPNCHNGFVIVTAIFWGLVELLIPPI